MVDSEHLQYVIKEISRNKNKPYGMNNEQLADELIQELKYIFPEAKLVKCDLGQWFILSDKANKKVIRIIEKSINKHEQILKDLKETLITLN